MAQQSSKKRKADASSSSKANEASSKSQKRALKHERQSHRKHADCVTEAKSIWNKLRLKNNSKDDVRKMASQLTELIKGKVNEIALQHDASRVVQAAIQFGTPEERRQILKELTQKGNHLAELAKNQYAQYVVTKSIKYCVTDKECVKMIVKAFKGHIPKLAVHANGSKIVEALFQTFPNKSTAALQQEFYGPHFALFATDVVHQSGPVPNLATHLSKSPDKKPHALQFIKTILEKGIEKSLFGYSWYQELFAEYVANASPNEVRDIGPSVVDHSIHLLSSKAGTRVVAACASYGTAKDRKRILKSLKGFSKSALLHRDAYLAVLRLVQVTDDTVSTHKNVFNELLTTPDKDDDEEDETTNEPQPPPLLELALNDQACKLFLMLLATTEVAFAKIFDPYELEVLEPNPTVVENGKEVPTRKKDPERHRQELVQHLQKPLLELCQTNARDLLFSLSGSALLREVYSTWASSNKDLVDAVVQVCVDELDAQQHDDKEQQLSLFEDRVGHLAVKNLILADVVEDDKGFAKAFYEAMKDRLMDVAHSNRGAFVVAAICKVPSVREEALQKLKKKTAKLKELADQQEQKANAGYKALLKEIEDK